MSADSFFQSLWYRRSFRVLSLLLTPLSWVFLLIVMLRRLAYGVGLFRSGIVSRPVIVVGNLTVGGTGKTPFTLWLAEQLRAGGHTPGIVLRGYGGRSREWPRDAHPDSDPLEVGDEAVLLANQSRGIVVAGPDRVAAARRAIERGADIIVSDDGLQHYGLARDCELAVVDANRGLGNGRMLPAGPLREPLSRLTQVDAIVLRLSQSHGGEAARAMRLPSATPHVSFAVRPTTVRSLRSGEVHSLAGFQGRSVHAVAGIGHPEAFFATLRQAGMNVIPHGLPDHARLSPVDLEFGDALPVLMTEKDAVKCANNDNPRLWVVGAEADVEPTQAAILMSIVESCIATARPPVADR